MDIEEFKLERIQSLWENLVEFNLTESGIHPYTLRELLEPEEIEDLLDTRLGYGWTNGAVELREAIGRLYANAGRDNVLVTNGSAEANFLTIWSLLGAGDELVLMLPNYMQIWGLARALGVDVRPLYLREEAGWAPDLEELGRLITPKTKMISVCNPNNPTGALLTRQAMETIVGLADERGIYLHADEIYRGSELNGQEGPSFADLYERAIVTSGLSKSMALPGLRIGWMVGPQNVIANAWHRHDYTTITTAIASERVATIAVRPERRAAILKRSREMLNHNLAMLEAWLAEHPGVFSLVPPQAGGMAFIRYTFGMNSTEFATRLRDEKSVFVIAGDCFGLDGYIRIGIGAESDYLRAGLRRIGDFVATLR